MAKSAAFLFRWRPKNYYSLASLVSVLKSSFNYPIILLKKDYLDIFREKAQKYERIYYFDSFMSMDVPTVQHEMKELYSIISHNRGKIIFCAGGSHPTAAPSHTISLGFNIVARGEGEIIINKIVEIIQNDMSWSNIPGITYLDRNGSIQSTTNPPRINIDDYLPYSNDPPITPPIEIIRGCSFGCKFCQTPRVLRKVRYRSLESIDEILSFYVKRFESRQSIDIRFIAPNILEYGSKDHRTPNLNALWNLVHIVQKYKNKKTNVRMFLGSFPSEIRPEFVNLETVKILKQSDSTKVAIGAQSGCDSMLQKMKRGHSIFDIQNSVDLLLEAKLIPQLDFILGNPGETTDEHSQTLNFCKELLEKGCRIRLHYFMPLPGTPWANNRPSLLSQSIKKEVNTLLNHPNVNGSFTQQMNIVDSLLQYQ